MHEIIRASQGGNDTKCIKIYIDIEADMLRSVQLIFSLKYMYMYMCAH